MINLPSVPDREHLAGEISHFEIPYSGCAILSSCEHPPSFCLFIGNGTSPVCVNNWQHLKSNRHYVFADALKVDNRREIARCEIEHPEQHSMHPSHRMQLSDNGLVGRKRSEQCLQRETRCCGLE